MSERDDEQPVADAIEAQTHVLDDRMREQTEELRRIADLLYEIAQRPGVIGRARQREEATR
ncbi:MAG: hypothetical protein DLM64_06085 [Solirubrobacterales bacterium]|nr:MAG: hypothetical protein DLM64_06085 [Solirubrobacterales bacterium]